MTQFQYLKVDGPTEIYDIVRDREMLGIARERVGAWYADRYGMTNPEVCGATRDEVAAKLELARSFCVVP